MKSRFYLIMNSVLFAVSLTLGVSNDDRQVNKDSKGKNVGSRSSLPMVTLTVWPLFRTKTKAKCGDRSSQQLRVIV